MANVSSSTKTPLIYTSSTKKIRPAIIFLSILLVCTAVSAILLIISSIGTLAIQQGSASLPILALATGLALLGYSIWYAKRLWFEAKKQYELGLSDEQLILTISEANGKKHIAKMAYANIDFVEYFTVRDQEALIFHGRDGRIIEVPVWCMEDEIQPAIDFLRQREVRTVRL